MPDDFQDTPTAEGATNVALHQRAATSPFAREVVNIQGDENPGRAIGFSAVGVLTTLDIPETPFVVVNTKDELVAAVATGGHIVVIGAITLTATLNITVAGTHLYGGFDPAQRAKLVFPGVANTVQSVVKISAPRVELHGLEITANNPLDPLTFNPRGTPGDLDGEILNPSNQRLDIGITVDHVVNTSDFLIEGCFIHHVTFGIHNSGSQSFPWVDRGRIVNNCIQSFNWFGIYLDWCFRDLLIEANWIWGRARGEPRTGGPPGVDETHAVPGNAIWVGDYIQRSTIRGNDCGHCDRHGIEIVNTETNDTISNDSNIIIANIVHDLVTPPGNPRIRHSMGISVACGGNGGIIEGNQVRNVTWFGIELHNRGNAQGNYIVHGNQICNVIGYDGYSAWAISVNSCTGAIISGNYIKCVEQEAGDNVNTVGIIVAGPAIGGVSTMSWTGVTVSDNEMVDAGNIGISLPGNTTSTRTAATINGNIIRLSAARQHRPANVIEVAVVLTDCGTAVVKDNIYFYPASLPPAGNGTSIGYPGWTPGTGFDILATGTVYAGGSADAPVVGSVGARTDIGGSNLKISFA